MIQSLWKNDYGVLKKLGIKHMTTMLDSMYLAKPTISRILPASCLNGTVLLPKFRSDDFSFL